MSFCKPQPVPTYQIISDEEEEQTKLISSNSKRKYIKINNLPLKIAKNNKSKKKVTFKQETNEDYILQFQKRNLETIKKIDLQFEKQKSETFNSCINNQSRKAIVNPKFMECHSLIQSLKDKLDQMKESNSQIDKIIKNCQRSVKNRRLVKQQLKIEENIQNVDLINSKISQSSSTEVIQICEENSRQLIKFSSPESFKNDDLSKEVIQEMQDDNLSEHYSDIKYNRSCSKSLGKIQEELIFNSESPTQKSFLNTCSSLLNQQLPKNLKFEQFDDQQEENEFTNQVSKVYDIEFEEIIIQIPKKRSLKRLRRNYKLEYEEKGENQALNMNRSKISVCEALDIDRNISKRFIRRTGVY